MRFFRFFELRRLVGGALAALLLMPISLPAMCGACLGAKVVADCAESHQASGKAAEDGEHRHHAGVNTHRGSVTQMEAVCGDCGQQQVSIAKTQQSVSWVYDLNSTAPVCSFSSSPTSASCSATYERAATVAAPQSLTSATAVSPTWHHPATLAEHGDIFCRSNHAFEYAVHSVHQVFKPLSVSLKI